MVEMVEFTEKDLKKVETILHKQREEIYKWLKEIFDKGKPKPLTPLNANQIRAEIKKKAEEYNEKESLFAVRCLLAAKDFDDREIIEFLLNIFYDDFERVDPYPIAYFTMVLEGIGDIFILDLHKAMGEPERLPISFSDLKAMREIYYRSNLDTPLMIIGETGTSKGLLARAIHKMGNRRKEKYEEINCAAISENLFESELFGHKKGSFTGAIEDKDGPLKSADKGTVFLDEIGKMRDHLQAKLLKVIEEKKIKPVGGKVIGIDVRFVAAAQPKDIKTIIPDLRYRLGFPNCITMSTLKERLATDSYVEIIQNSLKEAIKKTGVREDISINKKSYTKLLGYAEYKGHYRELENILSSAIMKAQQDHRNKILPKDLEEAMDIGEKFYGDNRAGLLSSDEPPLEEIKLKDVIEYADKKKKSIIEAKINEVLGSGNDLKPILKKEGLSEKEYENFLKKIRTITGRKIREFG